MESKKINQLATELAPVLSDLTIIGDPTTGISKKITLSQMASLFTGTVEEYASLSAFPLVGTADTIYIALNTNIIYRWNTGTSAYVELSPNIVTSLVFNDANGFDGTINLVGSTATLTITTALTTGSVPFIGASGALTQDNANLFWNNSTKRLGINTSSPTTALDIFGSGIIGRINGTSTNNAFLGFASAGTNKWSVGNVQSDHRFRIYNEATTSELVSVLQTGEFGIGIANPTTKLHIDGGASALIANLDANVSVAKSISFRSDNSARINLEVSGTESGSNAGADLFIRTYTDAGALLNTPLFIKRSSGNIGFGTTNPTRQFEIYNSNDAFMKFNGARVGNSVMSVGTESAGFVIYDDTNSAYRLVVKQNGNVGIGTNSPWGKFNVVAGTNLSFVVQDSGTADTIELTNYSNSGGLRAIQLNASTLSFGTGTAGGGSTSVKMTILPSGNIGIGTNSPTSLLHLSSSSSTAQVITSTGTNVYSSISLTNTTTGYGYDIGFGGSASIAPNSFYIYGGSSASVKLAINSTGDLTVNGGATLSKLTLGYNFYIENNQSPEIVSFVASSGSSIFRWMRQGTTESMRINGDGQVLMNTTSVLTSGWLCISVPSNNYNAIVLRDTGTTYTSANYYQVFTNSTNTIAGSISHNTATTIGFNTSSDYRLKEDFKDFNGLDILSNIKFYDFKWKEENKRMHGVIAHELEPLLPLAVSGTKDAIDEEGNIVAQGVDYSKIVPILGKAIQELKAEIEALKSK